MASRPIARDRSGSHPGRPWPRASPFPPSWCSPPAPGPPRSLAAHWTSRPRRRWRPRQPGRPLRQAPNASASPAPLDACTRGEIAAFLHRRVDRCNAIPGWDSIRVDEGPIWGGVREVLHAVVADALGELEGRLLLLGAPLVAPEPPGLQVLS